MQKRTLTEHDPELLAMVRNAQATWANADIPLPERFNKPQRRIVQAKRRRTREKKPFSSQSPEYGSYWRAGGVIDRSMRAQSNCA